MAISLDGKIGDKNELPWPTISDDMKHFRQTTTNQIVIMGRNTYHSILTKVNGVVGSLALKNRINIVITTNPFVSSHTVINENEALIVATSLDHAIEICRKQYPSKQIFVIGGKQVYQDALCHPNCQKLIITDIYDVYPHADCGFFNELPYTPICFQLFPKQEYQSEIIFDDKANLCYSFRRLIKESP